MSRYDRPRSEGWSEEELEIITRMGAEDRTIDECFSRLNKDYNDVLVKVREVLGKELRPSARSGSSSL
tara:strand:- start:361 stop:564 length:204 start_codon:yes stop_codon:yes gene_type:complete